MQHISALVQNDKKGETRKKKNDNAIVILKID